MRNVNKAERVTFWERPWNKRMVLGASVLEGLRLWMNIREYQDLLKVSEVIFSASEWEKYAARQIFQCSLNGLTLILFLGTFFIYILARSRRTAQLAEGVFLLISGLCWGVTGLVFQFYSLNESKWIWLFILLVDVAAGVYSLYKLKH